MRTLPPVQRSAEAATPVFMSVKPNYASLIMGGLKTVELRRRPPRIDETCVAVVYASSPVCAVLGTVVISQVHTDTPDAIWRVFSDAASIDRAAYDRYFLDAPLASALKLQDPVAFAEPVPLQALRSRYGLEPPQSWRYLPVGAGELAVRRSRVPSQPATNPLGQVVDTASRFLRCRWVPLR